jgi:hypothetical protein
MPEIADPHLTPEERRARNRLRALRWRRAHGIMPRKPAQRPWLAMGVSRRRDPLLREHRVIEADAIVRIAKAGTERLGRVRLGRRGDRRIAFCHLDRAWQ